jgi:hypothetical protein
MHLILMKAVEDSTIDPSTNTKHFMRLLVEGLNVLGPLNSAISIINSKISPEMKKVIHLVTSKVQPPPCVSARIY